MKKFLRFSLGLALSLNLFMPLMPPAQAQNQQTPITEPKGDKPAPVPPKPLGPPKSQDE